MKANAKLIRKEAIVGVELTLDADGLRVLRHALTAMAWAEPVQDSKPVIYRPWHDTRALTPSQVKHAKGLRDMVGDVIDAMEDENINAWAETPA